MISIILVGCASLTYEISGQRYPGKFWQKYATPEEAGWSSQKLEAAREYFEMLDSAAVMIVYNGAVLAAWGDVGRRYMCHSIRKSFLSALYGIYHDAGVIDLNKTLAQLQIHEKTPLTDQEKQARISDLLKARSGVYLPAAYALPPQRHGLPPRGRYAPGTHWYYSNWDFNVLATIFNQETGSDLFKEFERRIALPLQMEDFRLLDTYYHYERHYSIHPAYPFRMSAKDMARFGLLYLRRGNWKGTRILSEAWIQESIKAYSSNGLSGYGYLWWIQTIGKLKELGMYSARGFGEHAIVIIPKANLVVVHRVDTYQGKRVSFSEIGTLLEKILQSKVGAPKENPKLVPFPSTSQKMAVIQLPQEQLDNYVGTYIVEDDSIAKITRSGNKLLFRGPRGDIHRLLPLSPEKFISEDSLIPLHFKFNQQGEVEQIDIEVRSGHHVFANKNNLKTDIDKGAWISDLETFIPQLMDQADVPGLSIAVIRDAETIWTGSFGVKSNATKEAVNDSTVFQAASLSKTTFAYAVMKVVERGELDLDTPLSDYLPGHYIKNDDRVKLITARMVLSHVTGFPNWRPKGGALRLYFTPGEKFSYSGEGYVYLQKVVEHITGQPLDQFMQKQVFEPLGMRHSSYEWRDEYASNYAVGHTKFATATDRGPMRHANAASSLYTTAGDYARFLVAMMRGSGLQDKSIREMLTPQIQLESCVNCTRSKLPPSKRSEGNAWGLGWGLQTTDEGTSFWHWGDQGIFRCYTVAFKDQKIGLVYFTNSENGLAIRNELVYRTIGGQHPAFSWLHYDSYKFVGIPKMDTTVDAGVYDDYVGRYAYSILTVTREGDRVFAQATGEPKFEIFSKSETEFFWKVVDAQVEFVKDDEGKVTHARHHQGGKELIAPKINDTDVDADIMGQYAYAILTVTRYGDRLFAQLTGQREYEIFPKSETEFFWKVADAQVTFVKNEAGVVVKAIHRQHGKFEAPKIKPGLIPISARPSLPGSLPTKILKAIPAAYTIPYGDIVYVENDGRCSQGEVIKITGGHGGRGIPRKYECVKRPE
jgi:CubicO group peptidase (beta-lactamase class C family)